MFIIVVIFTNCNIYKMKNLMISNEIITKMELSRWMLGIEKKALTKLTNFEMKNLNLLSLNAIFEKIQIDFSKIKVVSEF